ncbi:MAG: phosphotransferase [Bacilli bacterium]
MKQDLSSLRAQFQRLIKQPILTIEMLKDGISNTNYLINGEYVYKLKTLGLDPFLDMNAEIYCQTLMADLHLAPNLINFDSDKAISISRYIKNTNYLHEPLLDDEIRLVVAAINTLHTLPKKRLRKFDPLLRYRTYQQLANCPSLLPLIEQQLLSEFGNYFANCQLVVSHNDVVRGNLLFDNQHLFLIDYEYAGLNDQLFDHLSFLSENNLDDCTFITQYFHIAFGQDYIVDYAFINRYILFLDFLWYYWALAYYQKTKKDIFVTIAEIKKTRIETRLHLTNF